jgi:hypothetical protein
MEAHGSQVTRETLGLQTLGRVEDVSEVVLGVVVVEVLASASSRKRVHGRGCSGWVRHALRPGYESIGGRDVADESRIGQ